MPEPLDLDALDDSLHRYGYLTVAEGDALIAELRATRAERDAMRTEASLLNNGVSVAYEQWLRAERAEAAIARVRDILRFFHAEAYHACRDALDGTDGD